MIGTLPIGVTPVGVPGVSAGNEYVATGGAQSGGSADIQFGVAYVGTGGAQSEVKILNPASGVLKTAHAQLATYQAADNILGGFRSIVWRASTAAINQIQFAPDGYNWGTSTGDQFVSGSSLKIYGLKTMTVLS